MTLACVLVFAPPAPAQELYDEFGIENLCAPDSYAQFDDHEYALAARDPEPKVLDYRTLQRVRIELLERGYNPGFDFERDPATDAELMDAVARFQAEYKLPVTGRLDAATLAKLYIPIHDTSAPPVMRAKPSK
jgi:hypothetical protein